MLLSTGAVSVPSLPNVQVLTLLAVRLTLMSASVTPTVADPSVIISMMSVVSANGPVEATNVLVNRPGIRLVFNSQPSAENLVASVSNCAMKP